MTLWHLKWRLYRLRQRAKPSALFASTLEQRFQTAPTTVRRPFTFVMKFATVMGVLALVIGVGTSGYAYASDDVLPDHPLYGLRTTIEQAEARIAPTMLRQAPDEVRAKILQRRIKELRLMRAKERLMKKERMQAFVQKAHDENVPTLEHTTDTRMKYAPLLKEVDEEVAHWKEPSEDERRKTREEAQARAERRAEESREQLERAKKERLERVREQREGR
ncbi:MAG: hypothetical protein WCV84_03435 [Patescibacteria group bacterium]